MKTLNKREALAPQNSITDMKRELLTTKDKLGTAIDSHQEKSFDAAQQAESWLTRFSTAHKALAVTENPLAIEALTILAEQAKQYALAYADLQEQETARKDALEEQKGKIDAAVNRLRILERSKALNSQLRKISSSIDTPVSDSVAQELDGREISLLIHTASALIELNTEKTIV